MAAVLANAAPLLRASPGRGGRGPPTLALLLLDSGASVVDYRRINRTIVRAIYYIRRCDDVKSSLVGSVFLSRFDGLKGFNLL